MTVRVGVVTVVRDRLEHLRHVQRGLSRCVSSSVEVDWTVVAVDDRAVEQWRPPSGVVPTVLPLQSAPATGFPAAAARNAGARRALGGRPDLLVFLDVDCIPSPGALEAYAGAARSRPDALLCGPVAYLPPAPPGGYDHDRLHLLASPHPARPAPVPGEVVGSGDHDLFWSLSFAVTPATWRTIGGFHDRYAGYGGEDTDLGRKADLLGIELAWVGGATAYHQHHPVSDPPVEHLDDILRNGALFARRWGEWPMGGWLESFREAGLVRRSDEGWVRTADQAVA